MSYLSSPYLLVGDYIGAGSVGVANLQVIEAELTEMKGIEVAHISTSPEFYRGNAHVLWFDGAYGTRGVHFLETSDNEEFNEWRDYILESLEVHPILDDDLHSEIDREWFEDAIELLADELSTQFFDELEMTQEEVAIALQEYEEEADQWGSDLTLLLCSYSEEYTGGYISLSKGEMEDIKNFLIKYQETA
jgi:hypothetical protein